MDGARDAVLSALSARVDDVVNKINADGQSECAGPELVTASTSAVGEANEFGACIFCARSYLESDRAQCLLLNELDVNMTQKAVCLHTLRKRF